MSSPALGDSGGLGAALDCRGTEGTRDASLAEGSSGSEGCACACDAGGFSGRLHEMQLILSRGLRVPWSSSAMPYCVEKGGEM